MQKYYKKTDNPRSQNLINFGSMQGEYVYLIGIGGVGMSSVAKILINEGCFVSGSDLQQTPVTHNLERLGARINTYQDGKNINPYTSMVITSASISEDNPDLKKVRTLGMKVIKCSEFLGSLMKNRQGIAVSGTHGKTTTSAMISVILEKSGLEPTFVIGGDVEEIGGSSCIGKGSFFVVEACEYDRTFLNLSPQVGVITNIDRDHLDYYKNISGITDAFSEFVSLIPEDGLLVINNDDVNARKVISNARCKTEKYSVIMANGKYLPDYVARAGGMYMLKPNLNKVMPELLENPLHGSDGFGLDATWLAVVYYFDKARSCFNVFYEGRYFGDFCIRATGLHNVSNSLAAISVCNYVGLNKNDIERSLRLFKGVDRRFQTISNRDGITIIDDYAHHPTEIRVTLETAKSIYPSKRLWCVFQPHQYNRTRLLLKEFAGALTLADKVVVTDIYAARDSDIDMVSVSSLDLVQELKERGGDVKYIENISEIVSSLHGDTEKDDVVVTMGAGDIWKAAYGLKECLENK